MVAAKASRLTQDVMATLLRDRASLALHFRYHRRRGAFSGAYVLVVWDCLAAMLCLGG